ncbi:19336_t:CDS:2, partial [Gigaspora rosea]
LLGQPIGYPTYGGQGKIGMILTMNENTSSNRTEEALNRLMEVVTRMMTQIQDQRRLFGPRPRVPPHPKIRKYGNNPPVHQAPTQTTPASSNNPNGVVPDPLQALYALLNNSTVTNSQGNPSYLGIPEDVKNLFLPADHHICKKPIAGTEILRKKTNAKVLDTSSGLIETEEVVIPDVDMAEGQEEPGAAPEEKHDP